MDYLYVFVGLVCGGAFVTLGVAFAALYTPHGYSLLDTAMTALTGGCLQVGNLVFVASMTALVFDILAGVAGLRYPLLVPAVLGYAVFHLLLYRSSISVTRLQETPLDPERVLTREGLERAVPSFGRLRRGRGNGG